MIFFVKATINCRSIVPAILAETFRGLTLYRLSLDFRTASGVELLYVWLVAHLFRGHSPQSQWFIDSPLPRLIGQMTTLSHIPQQLDMWVFALGSLTPDTIVWDIGLFSASGYGIIVCGQDLSFLPLLGLCGVVPYFGGRVLRQFGFYQDVPVSSSLYKSSQYHFDFAIDLVHPLVGEAAALWSQRMTPVCAGNVRPPLEIIVERNRMIGWSEDHRACHQILRKRTWIIFRARFLFRDSYISGCLCELFKLGIRDIGLVHKESIDEDLMHGT